MCNESALKIEHLTKEFFGVAAVTDVSLSIRRGETIALLGENGAGKSTLMKVVSGVYPFGSYSGNVVLGDEECRFSGVSDAEASGVVLVPQELRIAPKLSIAENAAMGALPNRHGIIDRKALREHARTCLKFFDIDADIDMPVRMLSASEQRLLMISSSLTKASPRVLILDEPTAALTPGEAIHLYDKIRQVSQAGVATIFITHRLDEIEEVCERALVMRNGRLVFETAKIKGGRSEIVHAMIGREHESKPPRKVIVGEKKLEISNLQVTKKTSPKRFVDGASLHVSAGEIVGLFGLVGAGRSELCMAVYGAWDGNVDGTITINGQTGRPRSPSQALDRGCAMLTEDRKLSGLFEGQSVLWNMSAASIKRVSNRNVIEKQKELQRNWTLARNLELRPLSMSRRVETYSGGNQQKVMLARWLAAEPELLIVDEPTIGVDIGARFEIYRILRELADDGKAILLVSSDIEEVVNETDRVIVMHKGRVTGHFPAGSSRQQLMNAATM
jgi:ABC-type sugar transport system ATPase subunit